MEGRRETGRETGEGPRRSTTHRRCTSCRWINNDGAWLSMSLVLLGCLCPDTHSTGSPRTKLAGLQNLTLINAAKYGERGNAADLDKAMRPTLINLFLSQACGIPMKMMGTFE